MEQKRPARRGASPKGQLIDLSKYKLIIETVQDYAIFLIDPEGYILTWNKGAERNKGYSEDEIIGKHFSVFYAQSDIDAGKPERELRIAARLGHIEDEDWRIRKDGSRFWASVVITALHDDNGELVGFAKVTRNLTERKRQEDELRRANAMLIQQQVELKTLNAAKDEFVSLASHQLRTPATAVKLVLAAILDGLYGEINPEVAAVIRKAYESNDRQIAIVNNLLRVAQVDAGKVVLRKSAVDINGFLADIVTEYRGQVSERNQTITVNTDGKEVAVVDAQHLQMAIGNIVDNASKYTGSGGTIELISRVYGKNLVIAVKDNGIGIPEESMPRLFEKFQRLNQPDIPKASGSGLGLYWSKKIVELHGGSIEVDSKAGKGSAFRVILPREGGAGCVRYSSWRMRICCARCMSWYCPLSPSSSRRLKTAATPSIRRVPPSSI